MKFWLFILDMLKGAFVGVANIIPGVSGGTMAVSMGVYDRIIESINHLFKKFKQSFLSLLPLILGMVIGIAAFSFIIPHCLEAYPFQTRMCFAGLILGGGPELISATGNALKREKRSINPFHLVLFIAFLALAVWMAILSPADSGSESLPTDWLSLLKLVGIGAIAAATMVLPGVSGSLVLMLLGYYAGIIGTIKLFLTALKGFNGTTLLHCVLVLIPFAIGCVLGIILISKLISWLFKRFESFTYCGILGLIAASAFAIFYKMGPVQLTTINVIVGVILFVAGTCLTFFVGKKKLNKEK